MEEIQNRLYGWLAGSPGAEMTLPEARHELELLREKVLDATIRDLTILAEARILDLQAVLAGIDEEIKKIAQD